MNFTRYNVFSTNLGHGNPAAVVELEEGQTYTDDVLKTIAQDMLCEVGFIFNPNGYLGTGVVNMRYFTAAKVELKFIGHVSVAALIHLAHGQDLAVTIQSKGGNIPAKVTGGEASFTIPVPSETYDQEVPTDLLEEALGPIDLDSRIITPVFAYGTSSRLIVFVDNLDRVKPSTEKIVSLSDYAKVSGVFVVELASDKKTTRSRMFCPLIGVAEDACSGNAHGMLGFVLHDKGLLPADNKFVGYQGAFVGRPSTVNVSLNPELKTAEVGGHAAVFCTGKIPAMSRQSTYEIW